MADLRRREPRINPRPLLYCAAGAAFGVFLYTSIRFHTLSPSGFLLPALFVLLALSPSRVRVGVFFLCAAVFAGAAVLAVHLYTENYISGNGGGNYEVTGTVDEFSVGHGYTTYTLKNLTFDGSKTGGRLQVTLGNDDLRPGDILSLHGNVRRLPLPEGDDTDAYVRNIRYEMTASVSSLKGKSHDPFLRLNGKIYDVLTNHMDFEEAALGYALLVGNSSAVDSGVLTSVRYGGIAHIFAVSGLHIGILYGAVTLLCRPLKKYAFLPALAVSFFYCAVCGFSVSAVRAVVMCAALGFVRLFGRKHDLLQSLSLAALFLLLLRPAEFLSAGFRLSFAAMLALALSSNALRRRLLALHFPKFLADTLSATFSVQIFTLPLLLELYGYISLWGFLLNPILVPLLPVLFLTLFLCTTFSLILPFAASFFLMFPEALLAAFLLFFSVVDFSAVLTGFSFGAGGIALTSGMILISERVRFSKMAKTGIAAGAAAALAFFFVIENFVLTGCRIDVPGGGSFALVRTVEGTAAVIGKKTSLSRCLAFLRNKEMGPIDGIFVLADDEDAATVVNVAVFLGAETIFLPHETETSLHENDVVVTDSVELFGLTFRFESREKLSVCGKNWVTEIDFLHGEALGADLFVGTAQTDLKFFLKDDIILSV